MQVEGGRGKLTQFEFNPLVACIATERKGDGCYKTNSYLRNIGKGHSPKRRQSPIWRCMRVPGPVNSAVSPSALGVSYPHGFDVLMTSRPSLRS